MAVSNRDMDGLLSDLLKEPIGGTPPPPPPRPPVRPKSPPPRNVQDVLRRPYLIALSYVGLTLSVGSTVIVGLRAEEIIRGSQTIIGALCGLAVAGLLTLGQWAFTPFHRTTRYTLGMFAFYLICLAPDVAISLSQVWHYIAGPLVMALTSVGSPIYWFFGGIVGILCTAASIGPESILFPRRK
jgi:hypothetical protein